MRSAGLGEHERIYLDHGYSGTKRDRPKLDQAIAAVREGDMLVVPKLDRLARSLVDAHEIAGQVTKHGGQLRIGVMVYDPTDPMGKLFFSILATFAEFEVDLLQMRTREGMAKARERGRLKGRQPSLKPAQRAHLVKLHGEGDHTPTDLAELFGVSRATVYREIERAGRAVSEPAT